MCGIAGLFDRVGTRTFDASLLDAMTDSLSHRGPDDRGTYRVPGVGLGHRRLSIIDLSAGHQPMFNKDGSVVVVYNGEIYNFAELMDELRGRGHVFQTRCDTEVIVHAWEEWGARCVERFRGMFAFALYDSAHGELCLARDRLGIKPLYYTEMADGTVAFGSELKALLEIPDLPREIDPQAVEEFFAFGYVPDPRSIYTGVHKLPPGCVQVIRRGSPLGAPWQYWDVTFDVSNPEKSEETNAEDLRAGLTDAVRARLVADVPLGAFLSGGVDSSAVVASMVATGADAIETCAIGFGEADYDESRYARRVAEHCGTQHHAREVASDDFGLLDVLPTVYDEPFADSSAIPTYRLCEQARKHVTVALSGDGGDEVFAGYRRHRWHHYEELVRRRLGQRIRGPLFGMLGRLYPKLDWAPKPLRAKATLQALACDTADGYFQSVCVVPDAQRERLYAPEFKQRLDGYRAVEHLRAVMAAAPSDHHLSSVQYADLKTYLPGDILTKVDRASMAHGLEVRVPMLDHKFVEWAGGVVPDQKLRGREGKYILKKAFETSLPRDVLYRAKMGFGVPLATWFRGPLASHVRDSLQAGALRRSGLFEAAAIDQLVEEHMSGTHDRTQAIWALLMFSGFLEKVHEKPARCAREPACA
jgi:asparagine synthase (glutamine-hydrolysing)